MAASPAQLVRQHLINVGVVNHPDVAGDWPAYVGKMPDDQDQMVHIKNTGGLMEGEILSSGQSINKPGLNFTIRAKDHPTAYDKAKQIWDALGAIFRNSVIVGGDTYVLWAFKRLTPPVYLGEEVGKRRELFSIDGRVSIVTGTLPPATPGEPAPQTSPVADAYESENKDSVIAREGMAVTVHSSGVGFLLALGTGTAKIAVGLVRQDLGVGLAGWVQTSGLFQMSDWTFVTGTLNLAARARYYLHPTDKGKLTTTPPTGDGQILQLIGTAVNPTTLDLLPEPPLVL